MSSVPVIPHPGYLQIRLDPDRDMVIIYTGERLTDCLVEHGRGWRDNPPMHINMGDYEIAPGEKMKVGRLEVTYARFMAAYSEQGNFWHLLQKNGLSAGTTEPAYYGQDPVTEKLLCSLNRMLTTQESQAADISVIAAATEAAISRQR